MRRFMAVICAVFMLFSFSSGLNLSSAEETKGETELIELSENLTYIGENAFEDVDDATFGVRFGSYAHQWCKKHGVRYVLMDDAPASGVNQVHSVDIFQEENGDKVIRCVFDAAEDCILKVDVMDDNGAEILFTETADAKGNSFSFTVDIALQKNLPKYFTLRAVLVNEDGSEISGRKISKHYTSSYEAFINRKPEDFARETVIDYGSSGFAVLSDDVILSNAPASVSGNRYTFSSSQDLKTGDMILLNASGEKTPVKIASVETNPDGTVTIVRDDKVYLSDMYDLIKVSGICGGRGGNEDNDAKSIQCTGTITFDTVTVSYDLTITVWAKFDYDKANDYFEANASVTISGSVSAFFGEEIDTWIDNSSPEIVLYNSDLPIPFFEAPAYLKVSLPVNIFAQVGGTASANVTYSYGFHYNPVSGWSSSVGRSATPHVDIGGRFSIKIGPEVSLNLNLFDAVEGRLSGQAGILIEGESEEPFFSGSLQAQNGEISHYHACYECIDMDYFFDIDMRGALTYEISPTLSGSLLDVKVGLYKEKLGDMHYSLHNDPNSIYEGKSKFDFGICPNNLYRTIIHTKDLNDDIVTGIPVTLTGSKIPNADNTLKNDSPMTVYLYRGSYSASAAFKTGEISEGFDVVSASMVVEIQEKAVTVEGVVTDESSNMPISGASVMLTLPDGSVKTAVTGTDGKYRFEKLPAGIYTVSASAPEYAMKTISKLNFLPGSKQNIPLRLETFMPDKEIMLKIMAHMGDEMVEKLKAAGIDVYGSFAYYTSGYGSPILTYMVGLRVDYSVYADNKALFRECEIAMIESGAFPLTEAQIAEVVYEINHARGVDIDVEYAGGFSAWGGMPINDVVIQFRYEPNVDNSLYTKKWSSNWTWDELTYENGRNSKQ